MKVEIVQGDLLDQQVDVIVNAWNRNLIPWWLLWPHGVSAAIKRCAGTGPFRELGRGLIPLGGARLTSAGRLPFKAIIHVAGINLCWLASERRRARQCAECGGARGSARLAVDRGAVDRCGSGWDESGTREGDHGG